MPSKIEYLNRVREGRCTRCGGKNDRPGMAKCYQCYAAELLRRKSVRLLEGKPVFTKQEVNIIKKSSSARSDLFLNPEYYNVAVLDIETTGLKGDFDIVLCGVIKPYGTFDSIEPTPFVINLEGKDMLKAEVEVIESLNEAIEGYDGVITYFGSRFDVPFLRIRSTYHGLKPIPKMKHLDLFFTVKRIFGPLSRKRMDSVNELFRIAEPDLPQKTNIDMREWMPAMFSHSETALNYVVEHCMKDVIILENLTKRLKDFVSDRIVRM